MQRVIDHGGWTETIIDLSNGGRLTLIDSKEPQPTPAVSLPLAGGPGTSLIGLMDSDEDVVTEWDREWGVQ